VLSCAGLHSAGLQPPLADGFISPIRWGSWWDSDGSVLTTDNDTSRMEASPCTNIRSSSTSDVIATYLNEEKERIKRRLKVIVHNTEESSTDDGQARKEHDVNTAMFSFVKKLAELQNFIIRPPIVGITETWYTSSISDAKLNLCKYNIFRCDRMDGRVGVV